MVSASSASVSANDKDDSSGSSCEVGRRIVAYVGGIDLTGKKNVLHYFIYSVCEAKRAIFLH